MSANLRRLAFLIRRPREFVSLQRERRVPNDEGYTFRPFDEHHAIFVHIPKCAGVAVCMGLFGSLAGGHTDVRTYEIVFGPTDFHRYFKFTIVRNPWDRLLSAFQFLRNEGMNEDDRRWAMEHLSPYDDFESFVLGWLNRENIRRGVHFRPQRDFISDHSGRIPIDYIGYFENLDSDFAQIASRIGVKASLTRLNETRSKNIDYRASYTEAMRNKVAEIYADDIRTLGYTFDNSSLASQLAQRRAQ